MELLAQFGEVDDAGHLGIEAGKGAGVSEQVVSAEAQHGFGNESLVGFCHHDSGLASIVSDPAGVTNDGQGRFGSSHGGVAETPVGGTQASALAGCQGLRVGSVVPQSVAAATNSVGNAGGEIGDHLRGIGFG